MLRYEMRFREGSMQRILVTGQLIVGDWSKSFKPILLHGHLSPTLWAR
jgi:hypothetical protein